MSMETEAKFPVNDFGPVRERLAALGGVCGSRVFEENVVLENNVAGRDSLRERGILLRLRKDREDGRGLLTVKQPPEKTSGFAKVCRELETGLDDFDSMLQALEVLGFEPAFRYEKVRETWLVKGCHVCLDEVSFGLFVEIEGEEQAIARLAERLGLDLATASDRNYHDLNRAYRQANNLPPQDGFTLPPARRERMRRELRLKK